MKFPKQLNLGMLNGTLILLSCKDNFATYCTKSMNNSTLYCELDVCFKDGKIELIDNRIPTRYYYKKEKK